jgi:hypothetical protein
MNYSEFRITQDYKFRMFTNGKLFQDIENPEFLKKSLKRHGYRMEDVKPLANGVYILKTFEDDFNEFLEQQRHDEHEYILGNLYEVIKCELWTYDVENSQLYDYKDIINRIVGLNPVEVEEYQDVIVKAIDDYKKEFYDQD